MAKPVDKSTARWWFWMREATAMHNPKDGWAKWQHRRALRRWMKRTAEEQRRESE